MHEICPLPGFFQGWGRGRWDKKKKKKNKEGRQTRNYLMCKICPHPGFFSRRHKIFPAPPTDRRPCFSTIPHPPLKPSPSSDKGWAWFDYKTENCEIRLHTCSLQRTSSSWKKKYRLFLNTSGIPLWYLTPPQSFGELIQASRTRTRSQERPPPRPAHINNLITPFLLT